MSHSKLAICEYVWLGNVGYQATWDLQEEWAGEIAVGRRLPTLMLLEHPHTYTFGRSGHQENLLWDAVQLQERGVEVHWVDRGGDITYHGPGQLVGYPLVPLGRPDPTGKLDRPDYLAYLRNIEAVLIDTLAHYGLAAGQVEGLTGVWIQPDVASRCPHCPPAARKRAAKLAAIGVKVDVHGVSRHGFALNVDPNMSYWDGIIPCGIDDHPVVSMADLMWKSPAIEDVAEVVAGAFGRVFGYEMRLSQAD